MKKKIDAKTVGELNDLFHDMFMAIGRGYGIGVMEVINEHDLTFPQMIILELLKQGTQTVSGLSEMLQFTPSAVSRLVDRMVRKGLVSRKEGDNDRRQKPLSLTPAGKRMHEQLERAVTSCFVAALSTLDPPLAEKLKDVLTQTVAALHSQGIHNS